jgi:hypothetical protein
VRKSRAFVAFGSHHREFRFLALVGSPKGPAATSLRTHIHEFHRRTVAVTSDRVHQTCRASGDAPYACQACVPPPVFIP